MTAGAEIRGMADRFRGAPAQAVGLVRAATTKAVLDTQTEARRRAPVDTGYLRSSITTNVDMSAGDFVAGEVTATCTFDRKASSDCIWEAALAPMLLLCLGGLLRRWCAGL